jgi:hypothetical protein
VRHTYIHIHRQTHTHRERELTQGPPTGAQVKENLWWSEVYREMKHAPPMTNAAFKLRETYEKYGLVPAPPAFVTHKPTRTYTHKHTHTPTRTSRHKHARTHTVCVSSGPTCACAYARLGCGPCVHFAYARVGVGCCQCSQHPVWGACQAAPALRRHARPAGSLGQRHPRRGASQTQRERRGTERQRRTFVHRHVHT